MPTSFAIDIHRWRGWGTGSDLFDHRLTAGFVTLYAHRNSIADWVAAQTNILDDVRTELRGLKAKLLGMAQ